MLSATGLALSYWYVEPDHILEVNGATQDLRKARVVLELVDTDERYAVERLGPAVRMKDLPSNSQIARAVGDIAIGSFAHPPRDDRVSGAIIDIVGDGIVAIAPEKKMPGIRDVIRRGPVVPAEAAAQLPVRTRTEPLPVPVSTEASSLPVASESKAVETKVAPPAGAKEATAKEPADQLSTKGTDVSPPQPVSVTAETVRIVHRPKAASAADSSTGPATTGSSTARKAAVLPNGEDQIELTLPEKMDLIQLLDLAGQYLGLDYVYDPEKVRSQPVTLKMHGKLQGKMRVRDLYALLETVLKFKGLGMTRQEGNLVRVVPLAEALEADPSLVEPGAASLESGDIVVTRIFELQHVDVASVSKLLETMKLSIAVSSIPETQTLLVTCYADRMARIERLLDLLDRPGKLRDLRLRPLKYTMAGTMAPKLTTLAAQLKDIVVVGATESQSVPKGKPDDRPASGRATIYLDTDERTNRIIMIGLPEELDLVEDLINALDVAQQELRVLRPYVAHYVQASEVMVCLEKLGIISRSSPARDRSFRAGPPGSSPQITTVQSALTEEPQVVLLESSNCLLINATQEQHRQIQSILGLMDVARQDRRDFEVYPIQHVDAKEVVKKLDELHLTGSGAQGARQVTKATEGTSAALSGTEDLLIDEPQVVVLEVSNTLLVRATGEQHRRIQALLRHIDMEPPQKLIPYEIYFLENQTPAHLAEVLTKIIQETVLNKEGKVEKVIPRSEDQIVIVPDEATFSLIVNANKKDQEWIGTLVKRLDRRRPQVLIDVTLVEIRKTDEFNYDLSLLTRSDANMPGFSGMRTGHLLQSVSGSFTGFYGDQHINALLTTMQSKNYGRVLAKPKVLVNDNEKGSIKTTQSTYVAKKSSIPVTSGSAGQQNTLIETAVDYQVYEAGVTLEITPHIGEGNLLRLDITTNRSDFGTVSGDKPPDKTSNDLKTVVTVPDRSTIILGGMLKLNQSKGGTKVPILGDLPLIGMAFRSVSNTDIQSKLYIFVRAEVIRPADAETAAMKDLLKVSDQNREAFEGSEAEFQQHQDIPALRPKPTDPAKVLESQ